MQLASLEAWRAIFNGVETYLGHGTGFWSARNVRHGVQGLLLGGDFEQSLVLHVFAYLRLLIFDSKNEMPGCTDHFH